MSSLARTSAATAGGLVLLAGVVVFFRTAPAPGPIPAPGDALSPSAGPLPSGEALPASGNTAVASGPATTLPPVPLPGAAAAATEAALPAVPSGDYEINLTEEQVGALVDRRYAALFPRLALSRDDLARFRALLVERQQAVIDAANSAVLVGVNPVRDLATVRRVIEAAQTDADAVLRQEMGDAVFAAWRDFDRTLRDRNSVADLARALAASPEPLRPEQERQVMEILQNAPGSDSPPDLERIIFGGINARAAISEQAVAAAGRVLSPRQLELFRELQQRGADPGSRPAPDARSAP